MAWIPDYLQITFDTLCALPPEEAAATMAAAGQAALEVLGMPPEECYCTLLFYAAHGPVTACSAVTSATTSTTARSWTSRKTPMRS